MAGDIVIEGWQCQEAGNCRQATLRTQETRTHVQARYWPALDEIRTLTHDAFVYDGATEVRLPGAVTRWLLSGRDDNGR
jgi:hypothetical protein